MEEKDIVTIKNLVNKEAKSPLKRYTKKYLKNLIANNNKINIETLNLLQQANYTIQNVHKLLKNNEIVDSATLMRSSMEKIMMGMMIYFDPENTYNEFKNLKKCGKGEYTKPFVLLNNFNLKIKEINPFLFEEFTEEELKMLFQETYEKLCLYTHSSLVVSMMIEVKRNKDEDLFIAFFYQMVYFLEVLLYCCLKYLNNDKKEHVDLFCLFLGGCILFIKIDKNKLDKEYIDKYKDFLHWDINSHFSDKYNTMIQQINNSVIEFKKEINNNPDIINDYISNLMITNK